MSLFSVRVYFLYEPIFFIVTDFERKEKGGGTKIKKQHILKVIGEGG